MSIILLIMSWIVISVRFRIALLQIRTSEMYDLVVGNILVSDKKNHLQTNTDGFFKNYVDQTNCERNVQFLFVCCR